MFVTHLIVFELHQHYKHLTSDKAKNNVEDALAAVAIGAGEDEGQ